MRNKGSSMSKTKILMVGPCETGKSFIANFLSEAASTESTGQSEYWPTQGVRIVEFEVPGLRVNNKPLDGEVELWDVSGNDKYESCWPAVQRDVMGVIFVYNPDKKEHERELEVWYKHFVHQQNIKDNQCLVLTHHKPNTTDRESVNLSSTFDRIPSVLTNIDDDPESCRSQFNHFLTGLLGTISESRDQEELSIMNSR